MKNSLKNSWTGKKSPTNPIKKEQHEGRKTREEILHKLENQDWKSSLKEYLDANK